jgi:phosphoenolpyruvate-protein kinase (PTS system EI component)
MNAMDFYLYRALLLAMLEHPLFRKQAERIINESGDLWLHLLIPTISKNPKLHSLKKIVHAIERQCAARDRIELADMEGLL